MLVPAFPSITLTSAIDSVGVDASTRLPAVVTPGSGTPDWLKKCANWKARGTLPTAGPVAKPTVIAPAPRSTAPEVATTAQRSRPATGRLQASVPLGIELVTWPGEVVASAL